MRSRLERMQEAYLDYIAAQEGKLLDRDETLNWERMHMASCARLGYLMAQERGVDPDLSACACAIHDIGRVVTGRQAGHAQAGLAPARAFLAGTGLFSPEEAELLAQAVAHHSDKAAVGTPIEEIVKDSDVVDCFQYGLPFARPEQERRSQSRQATRPGERDER